MNLNFPEPDVIEFKKILLRQIKGSRIHSAELHIDKEILKFLWENYFGEKWIEPVDYCSQKQVIKNIITIYKNLGFDTIRLSSDFRFSSNIIFPIKKKKLMILQF